MERQSLQALFAQALGCQVEGDLEKAARLYQELLQQYPDCVDAYTNLAVIFSGNGQQAQALELLEKAVAIQPDHVDALSNLAVLLRNSAQLAPAVERLQQALALDPHHADANYNLGVTLIEMSREAEAVEYLKAAVRANPDHHLAQANLARALNHTGQVQEALVHGQRTLQIKDQQACQAYQQLGLPNLKRSLQVKPFDPQAKRRNIISFSLFGTSPLYTEGAIINARLAPYFYPEWTLRFYCDRQVPQGVIQELETLGAEIVFFENRGPGWGLFRRFLVANEDVDRFLCRDCDSRLNVQERVAVDRWLQSKKPFHIMRDAPFHTELMLAGLWGGVGGVLPSLAPLVEKVYAEHEHKWMDQDFLRNFVWPMIKGHSLIHDSHYRLHGAEKFPKVGRRPSYLHVGAVESVTAAESHWLHDPLGSESTGRATLLDQDYLTIKRCRYGPLAFNKNDTFIGRSLATYGEWSYGELELLGQLLRPGDVVVDAGANIGTHTVYFSQAVGSQGRVIACEPQRHTFHLLCTNVTLSGQQNTECLPLALGANRDQLFIPTLDPTQEMNFGSLGLEGHESGTGQRVQVWPLDDLAEELGLDRCRLIKIDVEGMEVQVLRGAAAFIQRHRPMLFVENNQEKNSALLVQALQEMGYLLWWHITPYYNPHNFFKEQQNIFPNTFEANMLAIHESVESDIPLPSVQGPQDNWKRAFERIQKNGTS